MRAHHGVPDNFKPTRDRMVRAKKVPCSQCGAAIGEQCRKLDGTPANNIHRHRRGRAIQEGF